MLYCDVSPAVSPIKSTSQIHRYTVTFQEYNTAVVADMRYTQKKKYHNNIDCLSAIFTYFSQIKNEHHKISDAPHFGNKGF